MNPHFISSFGERRAADIRAEAARDRLARLCIPQRPAWPGLNLRTFILRLRLA